MHSRIVFFQFARYRCSSQTYKKYHKCISLYERESHLNNPRTLGECHDVTLLPEEGGVRALDHLKLAELLHGIHLLGHFVSYLQAQMCINIINIHINP